LQKILHCSADLGQELLNLSGHLLQIDSSFKKFFLQNEFIPCMKKKLLSIYILITKTSRNFDFHNF